MMPRQKAKGASDNANLKVKKVEWFNNVKNFHHDLTTFILLQKVESWVPGSTRNLETYILKDQVVLNILKFKVLFHCFKLRSLSTHDPVLINILKLSENEGQIFSFGILLMCSKYLADHWKCLMLCLGEGF